MESESLLLASGIGTIVCVILDRIISAIKHRQMEMAGVAEASSFGTGVRIMLSLIINFALCTGFIAISNAIGGGVAAPFLFAGCIWLVITIPMLLTSFGVDDVRRRTMVVGILGWLAKLGVMAGSAAIFLS